MLLLVFGVSWQTEHPAPVMVDLWQSLPKAASQPVAVPPPESAKPAPAFKPEKPAPAPKPEAEEPPPKAPDIALEKKRAETERLKKLKAIQEADDQARKDAAQAEADALKQARDKRQAEQKAEQKRQALLRQRRTSLRRMQPGRPNWLKRRQLARARLRCHKPSENIVT
ncbi:MAG: putative TonB protein [Proteobacteria bacterium]|nr:putative TonB protein [Pseudomonadota bacterium]